MKFSCDITYIASSQDIELSDDYRCDLMSKINYLKLEQKYEINPSWFWKPSNKKK
jgi:hypothetical protein